jgi:hypothetical protein
VPDIEVAIRVAQKIEAERALLREAVVARRAGVELSGAQGEALGRVSDATGALRRAPAANAKEIEPWIGKKVDAANAPPGYEIAKTKSGLIVRRIVARDALYARVGTDVVGQATLGRVGRTTRPGALAAAMGTRPLEHVAHHVVPDEVVRDSPLFREGTRRGVYLPDAASNGIWLPKTEEARVGRSSGLPLHRGSHPEDNELASKLAANAFDRLTTYGPISEAPDAVIRAACADVEAEMLRQVELWTHRGSGHLK